MKVLVALSGNGVYDGSEIQEAVLTLLHLDKCGIAYQCTAPNVNQFHVINHTNGEEMEEQRNILVESARIARGDIKNMANVSIEDYSGLVIPGGFGAAKNFTTWAFDGPNGTIQKEISTLIRAAVEMGKPILAMCMSPVVIAKALEGSGIDAKLTVGTDSEPTPYEIDSIGQGIESLGSKVEKVSVTDIVVDSKNQIITTPCYMMEAKISEIELGISKAVEQFKQML